MRVAIYARVSKELPSTPARKGKPGSPKPIAKTQDPENQLKELRAFCARSGWEIYQEYVDRASGKSGDRPQFKAMFEDASKRYFDIVLFWALDRFTREGVLTTLRYLERLSDWGVDWRSFQEPYFDSCGPFKDAVISIMATLAKQERIRISERTRLGLDRAKEAGKTLGRPHRLNPLEQKKIELLRSRGLSYRDISKQTKISLSTVVRGLKVNAA